MCYFQRPVPDRQKLGGSYTILVGQPLSLTKWVKVSLSLSLCRSARGRTLDHASRLVAHVSSLAPVTTAQSCAAPGPHHLGEKKGLDVEDDGGVGMDIVSCTWSTPSESLSHRASPRDRLPPPSVTGEAVDLGVRGWRGSTMGR
jgi:hypothetical protein